MPAIKDRIKKAYRSIYNILIGDRDLWQQLFNIACAVAIAGAFISGVLSLLLGNSPNAIAVILFTILFAIGCLILSLKARDVIYSAVLFCMVANIIMFPLMFFASGGYHGGMPLWLLLSLVMCFVVIRKKLVLFVVYTVTLAFECGCIVYSELHPESVDFFGSEHAIAMDVMQSLIVVSLIFGIIIKYQNSAYEKKQKELDKANAVLSEAYDRITLQSMYTLAKTIDAKDNYTNGHSMRVAKYTNMLAQRMHLPEEDIEEITKMAMLHDIGKIGVPDAIINKPTKLEPEEYNVIKGHPGIGFDILSEMPELRHIGIGARWHHERYDGCGYPDGLKGEEIPLAARIICVADAYDAMTSNRSYRSYIPQDIVKKELEEGKGTQFDPDIAQIMLEIMNEDKEYDLREH